MIQLGIENLIQHHRDLICGKRIGLLTNMTGLDNRFHTSIDILLHQKGCQLTALYAPEHGMRGDTKEGSAIPSTIDEITGLPVYSLYGATRKPTPEMLEKIDCMIIDLQDIGVRYYTFISSLGLIMEACEAQGKSVIVLDRPNPINGVDREGNIPQESLRSFVGLQPLPIRYGLTIGEVALVYKYEFGLDCELTVVPMEGWKRTMFFHDTDLCWIQPSPNATGEAMNILYPGMCLIEGTNLSEGRGTTRPFEVVGAPFINGRKLAEQFNQLKLSGILARPTSFIPYYSKYKNQICFGIQIHIITLRKVKAVKIGLSLLGLIAQMYPEQFFFMDSENDRCLFNLLIGDKQMKMRVFRNHFDDFFQKCEISCEKFSQQVVPFLLYSEK